jgi:hypothetical protein
MDGAVAQLAEHRLCKAGVRGSIPLGSTSTNVSAGKIAVQPSYSHRPIDGS